MAHPAPRAPRRATVESTDPARVADRVRADLGADNALVVVFADPQVPRAALAEQLARHDFGGPVIGCSTAGSIGPGGYHTVATTAFALPRGDFAVETVVLDGLARFDFEATVAKVRRGVERLHAAAPGASVATTFALLLIDGLSMREEVLASAVDAGLDGRPVFGGSAGDGLAFGSTGVLCEGTSASDRAVLAIVHTALPFRVFKTQHFTSESRRLVVTRADVERRFVHEFDGAPAADVYAQAVGVPRANLGPEVFSRHPVLVRVGGQDYVRSIQRVESDGSLVFFCAIGEGLVLRIGHGADLVADLAAALDRVRAEVGEPALVVAMDCILRRLELSHVDRMDEAGALLDAHAAVGFSTYGEQCGPMHVNQTLTGVAIGRRAA